MTRPFFEVRTRKEANAPYVVHTLYVRGTAIHAQIGPMSEADIEERIRKHLNPPAFVPVKSGWTMPKPGRPKKHPNRGADAPWAQLDRFTTEDNES